MKARVIAAVNVRRFLRDRSNLFFVFVFPIALVLIIGLQFSSQDDPKIGMVVAGGEPDLALAHAMVDQIETSDIEVVELADRDALVSDIESDQLDAGFVLPDGFASSVAAGDQVEIGYVARPEGAGPHMRAIVDDALASVLIEPTAVRAAVSRGADAATATEAASDRMSALAPVDVASVTAGEKLFPEGTAGFDVAAPSQLVLFMFTTGLSGVAALILTRKLGVSARMLSTPTSTRSIITGEALGRLAIGLVQGVYIMLLTALLFGVSWGDLLGAAVVLIAFASVSAGAAMLLGTLLDNEEAASGIGVVLSLALAALGGAMLPIELFGEGLKSAARATPHYWAIDAYAELIRHDGSVLDVAQQVGVLALFAAVLLLLASWRMRRALTSGA